MKKALARLMLLCLAFLALAKKAFAGELSPTRISLESGNFHDLAGGVPYNSYVETAPVYNAFLYSVLAFPLMALCLVSALIFFYKKLRKHNTGVTGPLAIISLVGYLVLSFLNGVVAVIYGTDEYGSPLTSVQQNPLVGYLPTILVYGVCVLSFCLYLFVRSVKARREKMKKLQAEKPVVNDVPPPTETKPPEGPTK
jgi:ABC-type xylose transport system permease subunit